MGEQKVQFYIDIVGSCNLRCPSCPKGNSSHVQNSAGVMSLELLDQILSKATGEYDIESVNLYNWTEPFVHPKLPEAIRLVHSHGLACGISSNLSFAPRLKEVMDEKPEGFKVSLSGFYQPVYERTHTGGNIEKVKENLQELARLWKENGRSSYVEVNFHRYLGNLDDEILMQKFVQELGLSFTTVYASFCPLEKTLNLHDSSIGAGLTPADEKFIELLYLTPYDYLEIARGVGKQYDCARYTNQIVLNHKGEAQLCCVVYDEVEYGVGNFLDQTRSELLNRRRSHDVCKSCCEIKANERVFTQDELDSIVSRTIAMQKARFFEYYSKSSMLTDLVLHETTAKGTSANSAGGLESKLKALESALAAKDEQIGELRKLVGQQNTRQ